MKKSKEGGGKKHYSTWLIRDIINRMEKQGSIVMENTPRRWVRITVVSIIFIAVSGIVILLSGWLFSFRMFSMQVHPDAPAGDLATISSLAVWGVVMLIFSIGLLKRIQVFRVLFIIWWILLCAAAFIFGLVSLLNYRPGSSSAGYFDQYPTLHYISYILNQLVISAVCLLIIWLVMSPRVSSDFKRKK
jgi:hypothetical protein